MLKQDRFNIIKKATELMPRITHSSNIKKLEREAALSKLDTQYDGVLRDMLAYIRQTVNSESVKTADDLVTAFRDACHAIGGVMTRAEWLAKPLIPETVSDRAAFASAISHMDADSILSGLDESDILYGCWCGNSANDAAYRAFDSYADIQHRDSELLAVFPLFVWLNRKGLDRVLP